MAREVLDNYYGDAKQCQPVLPSKCNELFAQPHRLTPVLIDQVVYFSRTYRKNLEYGVRRDMDALKVESVHLYLYPDTYTAEGNLNDKHALRHLYFVCLFNATGVDKRCVIGVGETAFPKHIPMWTDLLPDNVPRDIPFLLVEQEPYLPEIPFCTEMVSQLKDLLDRCDRVAPGFRHHRLWEGLRWNRQQGLSLIDFRWAECGSEPPLVRRDKEVVPPDTRFYEYLVQQVGLLHAEPYREVTEGRDVLAALTAVMSRPTVMKVQWRFPQHHPDLQSLCKRTVRPATVQFYHRQFGIWPRPFHDVGLRWSCPEGWMVLCCDRLFGRCREGIFSGHWDQAFIELELTLNAQTEPPKWGNWWMIRNKMRRTAYCQPHWTFAEILKCLWKMRPMERLPRGRWEPVLIHGRHVIRDRSGTPIT